MKFISASHANMLNESLSMKVVCTGPVEAALTNNQIAQYICLWPPQAKSISFIFDILARMSLHIKFAFFLYWFVFIQLNVNSKYCRSFWHQSTKNKFMHLLKFDSIGWSFKIISKVFKQCCWMSLQCVNGNENIKIFKRDMYIYFSWSNTVGLLQRAAAILCYLTTKHSSRNIRAFRTNHGFVLRW